MFVVVNPIARNLRRAALLFCCTASVACSTPVVDRDATTDASADASIADTGGDASGDGSACTDVAGSYMVRQTCSGLEPFTTTYCISQSGCNATVNVDGEAFDGVVAGNILTLRAGTQRCVFTFSGATATERCTDTGSSTMQMCSSTLTARTFPGATSYCCNPGVATSCGAGQRCVPGNEDVMAPGRLALTACVPNGTIAEGMPCTRTGGVIGADMCAEKTICANLGQPTVATRVCRRVCGNNTHCAAGEICRRLGFAPSSGFCTAKCTIGGTDCPTGNTCRTELAILGSGMPDQVQTNCTQVGTTAVGAPCTDSVQCAANSDCYSDPTVAGSMAICRQTCGPMSACPAGQTCRPRREVGPENPDALGHCYPS